MISLDEDHLKFFLQSPHWAAFPEEGGFPVFRERLHCLQRAVPQDLQLNEDDDPQPGEYLHIRYVWIDIKIIINQNLMIAAFTLLAHKPMLHLSLRYHSDITQYHSYITPKHVQTQFRSH